jgi:hypothetical protein
MSSHILIATMKPIEDSKYVFERYNLSIGSGEDYSIDLPLTCHIFMKFMDMKNSLLYLF